MVCTTHHSPFTTHQLLTCSDPRKLLWHDCAAHVNGASIGRKRSGVLTGPSSRRKEATIVQALEKERLPASNCPTFSFPRRTRDWLPLLWSKVLFPGHKP